MVCKCANPTCLVELHNLRGAKVYLFEIATVTGAKRPEPRDLNSKAKALGGSRGLSSATPFLQGEGWATAHEEEELHV